MLNWDSEDPTNLPLDKSYSFIGNKIIIGGVDHTGWLRYGTPEEIKYKIRELKDKYEPSRLIIGPGCAIPPEVPMENLQALKESL